MCFDYVDTILYIHHFSYYFASRSQISLFAEEGSSSLLVSVVSAFLSRWTHVCSKNRLKLVSHVIIY